MEKVCMDLGFDYNKGKYHLANEGLGERTILKWI
jgi:hypothetical protein